MIAFVQNLGGKHKVRVIKVESTSKIFPTKMQDGEKELNSEETKRLSAQHLLKPEACDEQFQLSFLNQSETIQPQISNGARLIVKPPLFHAEVPLDKVFTREMSVKLETVISKARVQVDGAGGKIVSYDSRLDKSVRFH